MVQVLVVYISRWCGQFQNKNNPVFPWVVQTTQVRPERIHSLKLLYGCTTKRHPVIYVQQLKTAVVLSQCHFTIVVTCLYVIYTLELPRSDPYF
jgi:hypothetical protein